MVDQVELVERVARAMRPVIFAGEAVPGSVVDRERNDTRAKARLALEASHHVELVEALNAVRKVRDGYASQMKFCDIEALGYFREFVRRIDTAIAKLPHPNNTGEV